MMDSISVKYGYNVSSLKRWSLVIVFKCLFVIFTIASMAPFIHRLTGGLKFQLISWGVNSASIPSWSKLFSDLESSLWAPVKLVLMSVKMFFGWSLLEMNQLKANIKVAVERLPTSSIWTMRVLKQVKIAPYFLEVWSVERVRLPCLMVRGSKYSVLVCE